MAEFYAARGWEIPPLPWTNLSPPFSGKELVERRITAFFADISAIHEASRSSTEEAIIRQRITQDAQRLSEAWRELPSDRKRAALCRLIWRITVRRETIDIAVRPSAIAQIPYRAEQGNFFVEQGMNCAGTGNLAAYQGA